MHRKISQLALGLALALLLVPLAGCESKEITIRIPDFDSKQVAGVWVWRLDPSSNQWVRDGQLEFHDTVLAGGREQLQYANVKIEDGEVDGMKLNADVLRDPLNPDSVTVRLWYFRYSAPGQFKVSTYNSAGDSPMTVTAANL